MNLSTVTVRGGTLAYTDTGSGPPLVLLHAFPLDRRMWRPQLDAFGGKARVITVDFPGFGQSPVGSQPFTIDSAADQIAGLLDALNIPGKVTVGGLSMGGYAALAFARGHPGRLAGLILADTKSDPDDDAGKQNRDRLIALTREFGPAAVYEAMLPKVISDHTREHRSDVVEEIRQIAAAQSAAGVIGGLVALRDRPNATPALGTIAVPTLILVGEHDAITPPAVAEGMAARIPGSRVVTTPAAGHLSNLENPEAFNAAVIEFLPA
jgi:pimeloyl-ACP methyl ester carboxylesterase